MNDYSLFDKLLSPLLLINGDFGVLFLNHAAEEAYSYNLEKSTIPPKCFQIAHGYNGPCYEQGERCPVKELMEEVNKSISAVNHLHKNGYYKVEAYRDDKNKPHFFELHIKISESENKLKESEELFRTLADNMPEGLDMHREKFLYANPGLQNMLGYTEEELKNMYFWDIVAEEHKEIAKNAIKKGIADLNYKHYVTFKVLKKTGEELWMYIHAGSVIYKGETVRIATFTDITELIDLRKQLEQEKESYKDLSVKDDLTGIFNRRKFESSLEDSMKLS